MSKPNSAAAFLANMQGGATEEASPPAVHEKPRRASAKAAAGTRNGLKHIGGYFTPDTVERVAILRARLNLDNSELIKLAIDELYSKQKAKRAFND
jgi:hypothetical protein